MEAHWWQIGTSIPPSDSKERGNFVQERLPKVVPYRQLDIMCLSDSKGIDDVGSKIIGSEMLK